LIRSAPVQPLKKTRAGRIETVELGPEKTIQLVHTRLEAYEQIGKALPG
jgi:hypothetical protein